MERIDLFDKYIQRRMSPEERKEFDVKLSSDPEFAEEFAAYEFVVSGLRREAHQDDMDFGIAMKKISRSDLLAAIGRKRTSPFDTIQEREPEVRASYAIPSSPADASKDELPAASGAPMPAARRSRGWVWQVASIAAVIALALVFGFRVERNARESVDNAIFSMTEMPEGSRSASSRVDLATLNERQIQKILPQLLTDYSSASDDDDIADNGNLLAMAYIRLHEREEAEKVLTELTARFGHDEDYAEDVKKWNTVLELLK